ncbi:MAG: maleylpyruvate isomerase family mycothiol-dependent enzyme [Candidatus Dormibacteraeota bacterium]|nr:maleylpyruvate isomerase family mycothiol-dependent enzyme [Candidatus Dormibacteraeota bacterium]
MIEATDQSTALVTLREVGARVVDLIAAIDNLDRPVPGLEWTVGDVAAHILIEVRAYAEAVGGSLAAIAVYVPEVDGYSRRMAAMTHGTLKAEPRRTPAELSAAVRDELQAFLRAVGGRAGTDTVETPWYGANETITVRTAVSLQIGEMLIHGLDIARGLGRPWPITPAEALQVICPSTLAMMPKVVDAPRVRGYDDLYRVNFRGGPRIGFRFTNGSIDVQDWSSWKQRAAVTLSADPVAFLLLAYGRKGQWPLIAQGKLVAYGRKPWLALQMRGLFVNP